MSDESLSVTVGGTYKDRTVRVLTEVKITIPPKTAKTLANICNRYRVIQPELNSLATALDSLLDGEDRGPQPPAPEEKDFAAATDPYPRLAKSGDKIIVLNHAVGLVSRYLGHTFIVNPIESSNLVGVRSPEGRFMRLLHHEYRIVDPDPSPLKVGDLVVANTYTSMSSNLGKLGTVKRIEDGPRGCQRLIYPSFDTISYFERKLTRVLPSPV